jgi:anti-anti-sigma factor
MTAEHFTLKAERSGETFGVTLVGELDMAATPLAGAGARAPDAEHRALVVEMGAVGFMDSSALGLLLASQQRLRADGIPFLLANPSGGVRRMLGLTGAGDELSITARPPGWPY